MPVRCSERGIGALVAFRHGMEIMARGWSARGEADVARIAGVNIPTNKRVVIALQYIHGIGAQARRRR